METPAFVLRRSGRDLLKDDRHGEQGLFDIYRDEFEWTWERSRAVS